MMKTLILVRHASAENYTTAKADLHRRLTDLGHQEAKKMAEKLKSKDLKIDAILSSPAKRTRETAENFRQILDFKGPLIIENNLYEATVRDYENVVSKINPEWNTVILFGHNPGITQFSDSLTDTSIQFMSNAAAFMAEADVAYWDDFLVEEKRFGFFETV